MEFLFKGRQVAVSGRLRYREWEAKGGGRRSEHTIAADRVEFLSGGKRREESAEADPVLAEA